MIVNGRLNIKQLRMIVIASILLVALFVVICLTVFLPKSDKVRYDIIYEGIDARGLIFRDESYVDLDGYEKLVYENVIEGQFLTQGTKIVIGYKKGYIKNTIEKLSETEKNIVTYQNQNVIVGFDDKKIQQIDFAIEVAISKMSQQHQGFIELYGELCALMNEREQHIRENYNIDSDVYLKELYKDEENLINSLQSWIDVRTAEKDGFVGFLCDGTESDFYIANALTVSYLDVKKALKEEYTDKLNGYKIVNDGKWYVIVTVDDVSQFTVGENYPLYISNETVNEVGCLEKIIDEKKGSALIFSIQDNVEKYLDLRVTSVFIGNRYEGFSIKSEYIKNGSVIVKDGKNKSNISVEVLYSDKDRTVFSVTEEISLGQKVYNK